MRKAAVNICRIILALTFIFSGFVKAVDPLGTQYKIHDYLVAMGLGRMVPDFTTLAMSVLLAATEFFLGICLLFAIRRRIVSKLVLAVMVMMTPLTLWLALADPITDCGCFGDAVVLTNWQTLWKNVLLLAAAIVVWKWPLDQPQLISRANQWIVMNYSLVFILLMAVKSLYTLPQFDFRPYHIGADIREGWRKMMNGEESPFQELFIEQTESGEDLTEQILYKCSAVRQLIRYLIVLIDGSFNILDLTNNFRGILSRHGNRLGRLLYGSCDGIHTTHHLAHDITEMI